jgi:hypothetical protein
MLLETVRTLPPDLVHFVEDVYRHTQSRVGLGLLHQRFDDVDRVKDHSLTRPRQMREEALLDRIVLGGIWRIVGDADLKPKAIG